MRRSLHKKLILPLPLLDNRRSVFVNLGTRVEGLILFPPLPLFALGKERKEKKELFLANPLAPPHQYWPCLGLKTSEGLTYLPQAR